jgi:opacity protein-like surface antigen
MRKLLFLLILTLSITASYAQVQLGIFTGLSNYQGDLVDKPYKAGRFAFGLTGGYQLSERFSVRAGLTFAKVGGADSLHEKQDLRQRNLSFQSAITEFSLRGEYNIFNLSSMKWTPYVFGGVAVYRFNPYTFDQAGTKVFLQPLGTEGQELPSNPDFKTYSLAQFSIPFGGGIKYAVSDKVHLGLEVGLRKLFTDYLDDVSSNYADEAELLAVRGPRSAELSYRGDELANGNPLYPTKGSQRGGAEVKDWYYFSGLTVTFNLGEGFGLGGGGRKGYGCPRVPL